MSFNRSLNTERGEWTLTFPASLPAGANDWRRDLAREADVIVIDRADLPEVTAKAAHGGTVLDVGDGTEYSVGNTPEHIAARRREAYRNLALIEYATAHLPDEALVEALAEDILRVDVPVNNGSEWPHSWARRLIAEGWSK